MDSEYYCGLPQNQWDILAEQAEEILRDQEYGQHILGLYPAGSRIYGIESSSPSLLCLYVDAVDNLINPFANSPKRFYKEPAGYSDSVIYFTELHSWGKWLHNACSGINVDFILPILPAVQDVFYEDESIGSIISIARDIVSTQNMFTFNEWNMDKVFLQVRAQVVYSFRKSFNPCINPDLGIVIGLDELGVNIPERIMSLDKTIADSYLGISNVNPRSKEIRELEQEYVNYMWTICRPGDSSDVKKQFNLLGKEIANLYRYQL
jgi:hypothetical protein